MSLSKTLQWQTFGQIEVTADDHQKVYNLFKENIKVMNKHLNGKKNIVGENLTVVDVYFSLALVEMLQVIMDANFKNSINNINGMFKQVMESKWFVNRMGCIKISKKQVLPVFAK